jgi:hypothetical protein
MAGIVALRGWGFGAREPATGMSKNIGALSHRLRLHGLPIPVTHAQPVYFFMSTTDGFAAKADFSGAAKHSIKSLMSKSSRNAFRRYQAWTTR